MKPSAILKICYMPRWIIVCMDVVLSFFAIMLSYLLRFNFETQKINKDSFMQAISITIAAYILFFFIFKPFKEIIRHTTINGILKISRAVLSANICLLLLNLIFDKHVVPTSISCINFFISFFMLSASRMGIKKVFSTAIQSKKQPIIIFGAGAMGRAALNTIKSDKFSTWKV